MFLLKKILIQMVAQTRIDLLCTMLSPRSANIHTRLILIGNYDGRSSQVFRRKLRNVYRRAFIETSTISLARMGFYV